MRQADITRKTAETDVTLSLYLDGEGTSKIETGCGFLDHMLTLFARHGGFDIEISADGDTYVDYHHLVEDVGICLGLAFAEALGDLRGAARYGDIILPMDEALILAAVDLSGRGFFACELDLPAEKVGDFDTELTEEFFIAFARNGRLTLHVQQLAGKNSHHIIEGCFKAVSRAMKKAVFLEPGNNTIPSTKGVL